MPEKGQGIGFFSCSAAAAPASDTVRLLCKLLEHHILKELEYAFVAVKSGDGNVAEGIQPFPFFPMISKIGFVMRESGEVQFLDPSCNSSAHLPAYLPESGPLHPHLRQSPLQEFHAFITAHSASL